MRNVMELGETEGRGEKRKPCAIYNSHLHNGINRTLVCIQWCGCVEMGRGVIAGGI